jgi:hypothetical protein
MVAKEYRACDYNRPQSKIQIKNRGDYGKTMSCSMYLVAMSVLAFLFR